MSYEDDKAKQELIRSVQIAAKKEYDDFIAKVRTAYETEIARLKADVIAPQEAEIASLKEEVSNLGNMAQLRANLYAFSDTFHLAAERIVETENPAEEAATLKSLADQLLQAVGLPPRKE